ncbi:MAG: hypothetical protein ACRD2A_03660 [Vicinamibacterales bacterium]
MKPTRTALGMAIVTLLLSAAASAQETGVLRIPSCSPTPPVL